MQAGPEQREVHVSRHQNEAVKRTQGAAYTLPNGPRLNWTSVHRNQSPVATPSVGNLQLMFPGLTQLQCATWPGQVTSPLQDSVSPSAKHLLTGIRWGPPDTMHSSHHCTRLPNAKICPHQLLSPRSPGLPNRNRLTDMFLSINYSQTHPYQGLAMHFKVSEMMIL